MVSAWVFVVWGHPKYLVGAIAGAASLRQVRTCHRVVLVYANMKFDHKPLLKIFDEIVEQPLLRFRVNPLRTKKQQELYGGEFSETANTKWQCLALEQYQKVMYVDSDIIFRRNCDFLFSLRAPAATFSSPFNETYSRGGFRNNYGRPRHGATIPCAQIREGLHDGAVAAGSLVLLEPSKQLQAKHVAWMKAHEPYGHHGCYSAIDEQSICEFLCDKQWTHVDPIYQAIPWKNNWCPGQNILRDAFALHFYHEKPFENSAMDQWPDTKIFWAVWHRFARDHPSLEAEYRKHMAHYVPPKK